MIRINPTPYTNLNFKAYKHTITNSQNEVVNRGDTCMFRNDLDFNSLISYLERKYSGISKVKVIAHACSDGEEAYSFVSNLIDKLGESGANKFFPILARDINDEHLSRAKSGKFFLESYENSAIDYYLDNSFDKYFDIIDKNFIGKTVQVKNNIKDRIQFKKADILKDAPKTDFKNTVLFARNFWPYLNTSDAEKLAKTLSEKMDITSTLVIGDYDCWGKIPTLLSKYGFRETQIKNVYECTNLSIAKSKCINLFKNFIK